MGVGDGEVVDRDVEVREALEHGSLDAGERDIPVDIFLGHIVDDSRQYRGVQRDLQDDDDHRPDAEDCPECRAEPAPRPFFDDILSHNLQI